MYQATLSGVNTLPSTSPVNVSNGVLDIEGATQVIGPLSGSTSGSVNLGTSLFVNGVGSDTTFAGVIGGTGGLTKAGPNTLTLTGSNTFLGATTVAAGRLLLIGSSSAALTGPLVIDSGAGGGGNGAFNGGITVNTGGTFSVGAPGNQPAPSAGPTADPPERQCPELQDRSQPG